MPSPPSGSHDVQGQIVQVFEDRAVPESKVRQRTERQDRGNTQSPDYESDAHCRHPSGHVKTFHDPGYGRLREG